MEPRRQINSIFKRFLDDCFLVRKKSEEDLQKFHTFLSSLHEKIKFTMEKNEKLPFLDILLYNERKKLHTNIFYKETDTHQYQNLPS